jgi:hypothetical protein
MITVTTADSKYSRKTDFGGPFGFVSGGGTRLCPLRPKRWEREKDFGSVFVSELLVEAGPLEGLLVISKIILDTLTAVVKFALKNAKTRYEPKPPCLPVSPHRYFFSKAFRRERAGRDAFAPMGITLPALLS